MMSNLPLPYRIAQQGITVIEASAGTGKTHTLIRLITRHILWYNKSIDQVLAVTFTKAATAELRTRLRDFLHAVEIFFRNPYDDQDIEYLISAAPAEITEAELYMRLTAAIGNIDQASIFTIHGFCQRILNEQPLLTGQSIPGPEYIENQNELIQQICFEFWRYIGQQSDYAEALQHTWPSPEQMLNMAYELLSNALLTPECPVNLIAPDFNTVFSIFKNAFLQNKVEAQQLLLQAIEAKAHNGVSHKANKTITQLNAIEIFIHSPTKNTVLDLSQIARSRFKTSKNGISPTNPLFDAADLWLDYTEQYQAYLQDLSLSLIHKFRTFLKDRLAVLKKQRNLISSDDLIDCLHDALIDDQTFDLVTKIREAYPVALVDEFQDTDDRQWAIFKKIYSGQENINLTLIGDPKQAIYAFRGGDIHTYLHARQEAQHVESLSNNYRSSVDMVNAVYQLFTHKDPHPFYEHNIDFIAVQAKSKIGALTIGGVKTPAFQIMPIAANEQGNPQNKGSATLLCAQQCAQQIAWLNHEITHQQAIINIDENNSRLLNFNDIAVLVATNKQAKLMQSCLHEAGIASVCVEKSSVFESYEALDVLNILNYLDKPSARQAQQNAHHGVLLQTLLADNALSTFDLTDYQDLWQKQGVLSCFSVILNHTEAAILALPNGERRLSNYWQIIELIQIENFDGIEHSEAIDWLSLQIESAQQYQQENSKQNPRLESGKNRIRILTLHQSKGLEFGVVYMPFTAISQIKKKQSNTLYRYFDGKQRCLYYQQDGLEQTLLDKIQVEQDSENLRILYVGVTRAKFALSVSFGFVKDIQQCALSRILLREDNPTAESIQKALQGFSITQCPVLSNQFTTLSKSEVSPIYLSNTRMMNDAWRISSFSGLHQSREQNYNNPASDEYDQISMTIKNPYKGAAFGNAMHHVLEHAEKLDWSAGKLNQLHQNARQLALSSLIQFGYDAVTAEQGVDLLCALVLNTLHGLLPEKISLLQLAEQDVRHELEFHLSLNNANCNEILKIMHQHGYCLNRLQFGFQQHLNGLLTGKIDLIYCYKNIYYVVDYKSNLLVDYQVSALAESIKTQEYDLQYLLYCVALHRYLRQKIGSSYHYEQHFGGVRYLYARGMQAGQCSGIFADCPNYSLIKQLDLCFDSAQKSNYVA